MTRLEKFAALLLYVLILGMFFVAASCDTTPRERVIRPNPIVRPTPRVVPPRSLHVRRTTGGWVVLEPNE